jgi:hypothetical protein
MLPWPDDEQGRSLAEFDPALWENRRAFHAARLRVAKSLGRPPLPELRGMVLVKRNNGKVL